jgi:Ca2+-binding EF-hand superfamily protein
MDLEYTVTENVHHNRSGDIVQIDYLFDETVTIETQTGGSITRQNREKRNRTYDVTIKREQYETLARGLPNSLRFDAFIDVLRPFIMGFYASNELERAFYTLDRDRSGTIHVEELNSFLPILNETMSSNALLDHIRKVDENFDGRMNYDEFRALVLRGIGRDIICNHI